MTEDSSFDEVKPGGLAAAAVATAAGSALELAVEGSGDLAALGVQTLANLMGRGVERRRRKALAAVEEACTHGATDYTTIEERAGADDQRIELTMRALAAAARADSEAKIRVLGRALATGVLTSDDAIVELETHVVDALDRIEAPHVRVLSILAETRIPQRNGVPYDVRDLAWPVPAIASEYPQAGAALPSLLATLVSVGAIVDIALGRADYSPTYEANDFGEMLLARLHRAGADDATT